jgi:ribosomal protein S27E
MSASDRCKNRAAAIQGDIVNALRIVLPVGLAAFIAALVIGYTHVLLQPGADCGSAFGGFNYARDTSFYVACAPLLSEKDTAATALLWLGIGLLVSSAALYWANLSPAANSRMPLVRRGPRPLSPPPDNAPDASQKRAPGKILDERPPEKTTKTQPAPRKTRNIRCFNCGHVQAFPISQTSFVCEQCGKKLRRIAPAEGT